MTKKDFFWIWFLRIGFSKVWLASFLVEAGALILVSFLSAKVFLWLKLLLDTTLVFWAVALAFAKVTGVKIFGSLFYGREVKKILVDAKSFCVDLRDELFVVVISPTEVIEAKKVRSQLDVLSERLALSWGGSASAWQPVPGLLFSHAWVMVCRK